MGATTLKELAKQKTIGRMTIGIDLGDRKSHFCVLNDHSCPPRQVCPRRLNFAEPGDIGSAYRRFAKRD